MLHLGHMILFQGENFDSEHKHIIDSVPDLSLTSGGFNNITSSIVVIDGVWQLFRDANFVGLIAELTAGDYSQVKEFGGGNSISSVRLIRSFVEPASVVRSAIESAVRSVVR